MDFPQPCFSLVVFRHLIQLWESMVEAPSEQSNSGSYLGAGHWQGIECQQPIHGLAWFGEGDECSQVEFPSCWSRHINTAILLWMTAPSLPSWVQLRYFPTIQQYSSCGPAACEWWDQRRLLHGNICNALWHVQKMNKKQSLIKF